MAAHSLTGVDRDVDRFVVKLASTSQVINMNAIWPVADGGPIEGANTDWKYYKKADQPQPPIDHRYTLDSVYSFTNTTPTPAEGYPFGTYGAVFTPVKLPLDDLLKQIESEFNRQVRLQFPESENPATIVDVGGILVKQMAGSVLTADEVAASSAFVAVREKIVQLRTRRDELIAAATADEDYDLSVWPTFS